MAIRMDSKLVTELENDPLILKLSASLNKDNRFFTKAWVIYKSEKWFPVLAEGKKTKILGLCHPIVTDANIPILSKHQPMVNQTSD